MKKKLKYVKLLILLIIIISVPVQSFASDNYHIFPVTSAKKTDVIERNLNIPVMIGFGDKEIQKKYNDIIRNDIFDFIMEAQKEIVEYRKEALENDFPFHQCSIFVEYKVYKKENDFLSMILELYKFIGGAHGITKRKSYNMDMSTGDVLTLSDFFKRARISKEEINNIIKKKIDKELDKYFSDEMSFKSVVDDQGFYLKDDDLIVFFQLYEIAPYIRGFPEFVIPLKKYDE